VSGFCLDTSAYSHFKRGNEELAGLLDGAEALGVASIVLGELQTGFTLGARQRENEAELDAFLANPVVEVLAVDAQCARHYAEIVVELRGAGTPVPSNDIWIAATAARSGLAVLSCDQHFAKIGRVGSLIVEA
jgi:predicted nucleic acid-binding protein